MNTTEQRIVSHETLHASAIISIKLPKNVSQGQAKDSHENVLAEYLHWAVNLPGGMVNVFVHSTDTSLANTTIRARVEVKVKTTVTGRQFIFVDLYPVDEAERPTHRLVVIEEKVEQKAEWLVFPAPNLRGYVALIGPDEKLVPPPVVKAISETIVGKQRRAPSVPSSAPSIEGNRPFAGVLAGLKL